MRGLGHCTSSVPEMGPGAGPGSVTGPRLGTTSRLLAPPCCPGPEGGWWRAMAAACPGRRRSRFTDPNGEAGGGMEEGSQLQRGLRGSPSAVPQLSDSL